MVKPLTSPPEWRRRAGLAAGWVVDGDLRSARAGMAALDRGDEATVLRAAEVCRAVVWSQPDDVVGVVAAPDLVVLAHAGPQPFDVLGLAIGFLALAFEAAGDSADLEAASELHDLTVALGDDVWSALQGWRVGWAAAVLYAVTGEQAFLATAERVADGMCEAQGGDGSWAGSAEITVGAAALLQEMADAVEGRGDIDAEPEPEGGAEPGG